MVKIYKFADNWVVDSSLPILLQIKVEERHSGNYCGLDTFVLVEQMVKIFNMVTNYWVFA
jgi:hypothetical protein